jgi:uncharacterized protein (TIGR02118 family)
MTVCVSVLYRAEDVTRFDFDYYVDHHLALVRERWGTSGLTRAEAFRGLADPSGAAPDMHAIALLHFDSMRSLEAAMAGPHMAEIAADVGVFTDAPPRLQINAVIAG